MTPARPERQLCASTPKGATQHALLAGSLCTMLIVGALGLPAASAQTVAPEFRTAPRSLVTSTVDRTRTATVKGAVNPLAAKLTDLGPTDPSQVIEHMQFVLARPSERQAAFDAIAEAVNKPGTSSFHQWLTPEVIGAEFGPSQSDIVTVTSFLESEGFTVTAPPASGMFVDFTGTVAQVENTFHAGIHNFQMKDGSIKYSATADASIPEALSALVRFVSPLGNMLSGQSGATLKSEPPKAPTASSRKSSKPLDTTSAGYYNVGPQDFYTIYNENATLRAATTGSGATIALLEESNVVSTDITTFRSTFGIAAASTLTLNSQGSGSPCTSPGVTTTKKPEAPNEINNPEVVADIDIEWAGAVAPGAALLHISCADSTYIGPVYAAEYVVGAPTVADIMVMSYSVPEGINAAEDTLVYNLWEQAAAQGQTVVVSAGNTGAAAKDGYEATNATNEVDGSEYGITVNSLSSTPWNVSVGGTDFMDGYNADQGSATAYQRSSLWTQTTSTATNYYSSALSYVPETAWNDNCGSSILANDEGYTSPASYCSSVFEDPYNFSAGGGGPSANTTTRPTWQNATVYGLPTSGGRLQPDVSFFAADGLWYHELDYYLTSKKMAGGTAFSAAQLAGVFALIKQKTGERLGQPNYILYSLAGTEFGTGTTPSAITTANTCNGSGTTNIATGVTTRSPLATCNFYDVQSSNNGVYCEEGTTDCSSSSYSVLTTATNGSTIAYNTTAGYDMATGIGSINVANLVNSWSTVTLTPTVTLSPAGTATVPGSIPYGTSSFSVTATVAAPSTGGSYPTGSVTFAITPTVTGFAATDSLVATGCTTGLSTCSEVATDTVATSAFTAGTVYTVTGTYSTTNENYTTATGTTYIEVGKQTPGLSVSATNISYGTAESTITITFTYTGTGTAPTGNPTLTINGTATGVTCGSFTGSSTLYTKSCTYTTTTPLAPGSYALAASYAGDTNYTSATASSTLTISQQTPVVTVSNVSVAYGASATLSLTYSWTSVTGTTPPSGAVTFVVNGTTVSAICGTTTTSPVTCTGTYNPATPATVGTYVITGTIAADTNYTASSNSGTLTVTGVTPTVTVAAESMPYGESTSLSMTIAYTGSYGVPAGTASFTVNGTTVAATCTGTSSPLTCTGTYAPTTAAAVGSYTITGSITASGAYSYASGTNTLTISKQTSTNTVNTATVAYGGSTTLSYYANWIGDGTAMTVYSIYYPYVNGVQTTLSYGCTAPAAGATATSANSDLCTTSTAYAPTTALAVGTYTMTEGSATVRPTADYTAPSAATSGSYIVTAQTPTVTVTTPATTTYGNPVTLTAKVAFTGTGVSAPTGAVSFTVNGVATSAASCSGTTSPVTCTLSYNPGTLAPGSYTFTATIAANGNYGVATSASGTLTISKQQLPTATIASVSSPYGYTGGTVITLKDLYTGYGNAPSGAVTLTVNGVTQTATCSSSGTAPSLTNVCTSTFNTGAFASGTYTITSTVAGDTNYLAPTTAATGTLTITVNSSSLTITTPATQHTMVPTVTLTATSNGTGAITFTYVSGPGSVSGNTLTITGAGVIKVSATQAADATYSTTTVTNSFTVLAGSIWLVDTTDKLSTFDKLGNAISSSSGYSTTGLSTVEGPLGETFDNSGNAYVVTSAGVSGFTYTAATINSSPYTSGGISTPDSIAIDGNGNLWTANSNGSVSEITTSGTALSPSTGYTGNAGSGLSTPGAIAVDLSGNVWVSNTSDNSVTEVLGAGAPVAPLSTSIANSTQGARP